MAHAKFINPYTDFGFKKLFGEEAGKDLLIDFLNELLPEKHKIADLTFKNPENQGDITSDRKAIFDIHCTTRDNHRIIVEMQKAKMKFFKDRTVFYTSFPIREQAEKGEWNFKLMPVYCVAILDIPDILKEPIFEKGFQIAELSNYTREELAEYEASLMIYRDLKGVIDTSYEEGKIEGKIETARNMLAEGIAVDIICKCTGLNEDEIGKIDQ